MQYAVVFFQARWMVMSGKDKRRGDCYNFLSALGESAEQYGSIVHVSEAIPISPQEHAHVRTFPRTNSNAD